MEPVAISLIIKNYHVIENSIKMGRITPSEAAPLMKRIFDIFPELRDSPALFRALVMMKDEHHDIVIMPLFVEMMRHIPIHGTDDFIPVAIAMEGLRPRLVQYLVELGADINTIYDMRTMTPNSLWGTITHNTPMREYLLTAGLDLSWTASDGRNILHYTCAHECQYGISYTDTNRAISQFIRAGADPNHRDNAGLLPYDYFVQRNPPAAQLALMQQALAAKIE